MIRKFLNKIRLAFYYLIQGLISGDKIIRNGEGGDSSLIGGIEQQQEQQSVYKDLLRGEVTQEVIELRHQTYFVERESHKYEYGGGGNAKKKNSMFSLNVLNVEQSDGYDIKLIQENSQIVRSLDEEGIHLGENEITLDAKYAKAYMPVAINNEYRIHCERDFTPRFRIEKYTTQVVVKNIDNEHALIDFYLPQERQQFNNVTKFLQSELSRIYQGFVKSDLVKFDKIWFETSKCYGSDDNFLYEYDEPQFDNIVKYNGSYVLRFYCHILIDGKDLISEFYDETTAKKYENHERREGATADFDKMRIIEERSKIDLSDDIGLMDSITDKEKTVE